MRPKGHRQMLERQIEVFNLDYPVGSEVVYFPLKDKNGLGGLARRTKTFCAAEILGGHSAVVWVEGVRGCLCLDWVVPRDKVDLEGVTFDGDFNHFWEL